MIPYNSGLKWSGGIANMMSVRLSSGLPLNSRAGRFPRSVWTNTYEKMKSDTQRNTTFRTKTTTTTKETRSSQPQGLATPTIPVEAKPKLQPSREDIARRAYEIYVARGKTDGGQVEDWIQAERELLTVINQRNN
jgi:Protein of unknown function (DUF2934)